MTLNGRRGFGFCLLLALQTSADAQSTAALQGRVADPVGAVVAGAEIILRDRTMGVGRTARTDGEGNYQVTALAVGTYRVEVWDRGFMRQVIDALEVEVGRTVVRNFRLEVGDVE